MSEQDKKNEQASTNHEQTQRIEKKDEKVVVHLKVPLTRKEGKPITFLTLNEPTYSQLEDFTLDDLNKVAVLPVLIPRIAEEEVFESDFKAMKLSDLVPLNMALTAFI